VTSSRKVVVTDANVLINLMHVSRLEICERLPNHEFVVPDHVREEITNPAQRSALTTALDRGNLRVEVLDDINSIALFAELRMRVGRGEAACLAMAVERGWFVASDEKKRFRREAEARIGKDRILGTADLFVLAIRAQILSIDDADSDKLVLERQRFKMPFESFRDLLR
jgi:predicted nucleic acid-binding protein